MEQPEDALISFSQLGEDVVIGHLLRNVVKKRGVGFYVDVGAFHPTRYSNTALLFAQGWRGINIDADAATIALFEAARPRDVSICTGIAKEATTRDFYVFEGGAPSTLDPATRDRWVRGGRKLLETRQISVGPLAEVVAAHMDEGSSIDYLNIDVEGLDFEVLKTFDFKRWKPSIISIEIHGFDFLRPLDNPVVSFLIERRYRLVAFCVVTAIFVLQ